MIVVDASVWVSYLIPTDVNHSTSHHWLSRMIGEQPMAAPVLLLAEVGGAISRRTGRTALGNKAISRLLSLPILRLVGIDHELGFQIARLAAELRLRGADAAYVAVAAALNIPLVSWDSEQLDRAATVIRGYKPEAQTLS
jgi:predicted nucleic acid-binding protein